MMCNKYFQKGLDCRNTADEDNDNYDHIAVSQKGGANNAVSEIGKLVNAVKECSLPKKDQFATGEERVFKISQISPDKYIWSSATQQICEDYLIEVLT